MNDLASSPFNSLIVSEAEEGVVLVKLNRPERLNLVDAKMQRELTALLTSLNDDEQVRAVVLTGEGSAFSAGEDLEELAAEIAAQTSQRPAQVLRGGNRLFNALLDFQPPLLAMLNGPAIGLGATIALLADVVVMAESATIGDHHVGLGVVAGDGGAAVWPLLVGVARAKEMLMTGRLVSAEEAVRIGLASAAVPDDQLSQTILTMARQLASQPAFAIRATKTAVNRLVRRSADDVLDVGLEWQRLSLRNARNIDPIGWLKSQAPA